MEELPESAAAGFSPVRGDFNLNQGVFMSDIFSAEGPAVIGLVSAGTGIIVLTVASFLRGQRGRPRRKY
jgi:hypothetical protein